VENFSHCSLIDERSSQTGVRNHLALHRAAVKLNVVIKSAPEEYLQKHISRMTSRERRALPKKKGLRLDCLGLKENAERCEAARVE
jgi:hypothetical protein